MIIFCVLKDYELNFVMTTFIDSPTDRNFAAELHARVNPGIKDSHSTLDQTYRRIINVALRRDAPRGVYSTTIHMVPRANDANAAHISARWIFWDCIDYNDKFLELLKTRFKADGFDFKYKQVYRKVRKSPGVYHDISDGYVVTLSWNPFKKSRSCMCM